MSDKGTIETREKIKSRQKSNIKVVFVKMCGLRVKGKERKKSKRKRKKQTKKERKKERKKD